ncbi:hypothetical protein [Streptomyces flaveolus]|uniref:hypothetical protein n=1 Tax=Streptomyces flaveolus TaxID=67297 RepID=UPI00332789B4
MRSAWRYFGAAVLADRLAGSAQAFTEGSSATDAGQAPMPPIDKPELALVLAGLAQSGGDLFSVIVNVAVNAWMAGHIHGEGGCTGCDGSRGPGGHDWQARMRVITEMQPDIWTPGACVKSFAHEHTA